MARKFTIGITQGDGNGIGYEVIIKALADERMLDICTPVIYGSSKIFGFYKKQIHNLEQINTNIISSAKEAHQKRVNIINCLPDNIFVEPGQSTPESAKSAMTALEWAVNDLKAGNIDALVTAPINKRAMVNEGVAWPIIFILAFVLPLSGPISDPRSGITAFMLEILTPFFGTGSGIKFLICIGIVGVILTQFINNTAISVALMPVIFSYCTANGMLAEQPVILVTVACCLAFLTPAASSTAAMLHGNDWITTRAIWRTAPILVVASLCIVTAVVILTGKIFL